MLIASADRMEQLGGSLARQIDGQMGSGLVIHLVGDLGAGKTTLVRGLLRGLGYAGTVRSPTYALIESYEIAGITVHHFDLYRLTDPGELEYIGIRDLAANSLLLVEWPEHGAGVIPAPDLVIRIGHDGERRHVELVARSGFGQRIIDRLDG
ncbi:MAG: tRNA (adenosine(37)-N6)-threonylcarbamoyltransferase complex ATPase subunit type 1 TsaE [Gammaproteobacteria bacterium]|nr:tRNA (adenosine(37)-N6)-threonylcarbamoyltransferase complex ATPase subunit type 1 TsaE [Gammaproteobacteria bacterium]